jgi:hypothetical protein
MTHQDNGGPITPRHVELGWGAPPISEQFAGVLPKDTLEMFDKDKDAISQLRLRGYMTDSAHAAIVRKFTKSLGAKIRAARMVQP